MHRSLPGTPYAAGPLTGPPRTSSTLRPNRSVRGVVPFAHRLADRVQQLREPRLPGVERLAALDARELDHPQRVAVLLVLTDHTALATQSRIDRELGALRDQSQVVLVRSRGAGEVAALLHHGLVGANQGRELLGEPGARVDGVQLHVTEGVARGRLAAVDELGDDRLDAGALREKDVHSADLVHDGPQPRR